MIPPNAYRLDGFFMALVAFTYDLMNGSEAWSSMWCFTSYFTGCRPPLNRQMVLMLWLQLRRPHTYYSFFRFPLFLSVSEENTDISVFHFFLFHLEFVWEHKKIGSKNFFICSRVVFSSRSNAYLIWLLLFVGGKVASRRANILPWNVLNSAWFAATDSRADQSAFIYVWFMVPFLFSFSLMFSFLVRSDYRIPGHWKRRRSFR